MGPHARSDSMRRCEMSIVAQNDVKARIPGWRKTGHNHVKERPHQKGQTHHPRSTNATFDVAQGLEWPGGERGQREQNGKGRRKRLHKRGEGRIEGKKRGKERSNRCYRSEEKQLEWL